MTILVILVGAVLVGLSILHALWAFGVWVPISRESDLVAAVIGGRGITRMPGPIPCGLVSVGLLAVAVALLVRGAWIADLILWAATAVFATRGVMSWLPMWRRITPQEPFASYDRRYYGPLCLGLAAGIALTVG